MTKVSVAAPSLRFQGFKDDWKKRRLDAVTERIQDGTHFSPPLLDEGQYKYISARNIRNGEMLLHDMQYVDEAHHRDIYRRSDVKFGDVLLTKDGASTGNVCLNELHDEFSLLSSVAFIRADEMNSTNAFIYQYLFSPYGQSEVRSVIAGQAITRITLEKLRAFKFGFPTLPEQQKIAAFLGAVDRKIQQLKRKQALLEQYKKGVVQQLFSQELRFKRKDGGEFPAWEEKRLGDVVTFTKGKGVSKGDIVEGGATKCIRYGELYTTYAEVIDEVVSSTNVDPSQLQLSKKNDVIIPASGETQLDIAKASCVMHDGIALGGDLNVLRTKENGVFLAYYLNGAKRNAIAEMAQGNAVVHLYAKQLQGISIELPTHEEQSRIAGFLMALDAKLAGVAQAVAAAQKWKKGLLQQMFV